MKIKTNVRLNIRTEPTLDATIHKVVPKGTVMEAESKTDGWYKLSDGYCMAEYVKVVQEKKKK